MSIDVLSALVGLAALPAVGTCWWLGHRTKMAVLRHVRGAVPSSALSRAAFAARVYAGRKVWVLRLPDACVAVTLGRSYAEEQQALSVLLKEFANVPAPARIRGRTW